MDILLFFGGKSVEHEVSIKTASFIKNNLLKLGHRVKDIFIKKDGTFTHNECEVSIKPNSGFFIGETQIKAGCAFIAMHGAYGEDGRIQGLLEMLNIPYISTDSLSSAIGMHKALQYKVLKEKDIPFLPYLCYSYNDEINFDTIVKTLGSDLILKPEAGGSSVGVMHLKEAQKDKFESCIKNLFLLDDRILIQPYLTEATELMIGVYETDGQTVAIGPGMMKCGSDLLDYKAKYTKTDKAVFIPKPELNMEIKEKALNLAKVIFRELGCTFYSRVDLFLKGDKLYLNEINTIPGFTETSYFPRLLEQDIGVEKFLTLMLEESFRIHKRRQKIVTTYV